ncbi:MAG: hypothetical protein A2082_02740 [Chloroflexi bacterium GWC2_70_10]|nr:MAG: hypothetical protein A2082_02740 [Chloroflexi bacterium GWC2_70_10]
MGSAARIRRPLCMFTILGPGGLRRRAGRPIGAGPWPLSPPSPARDDLIVNELFVTIAVISLLAGSAYLVYNRPIDAARHALHAALERGEISRAQYAAHLRALEDGA